MDSPPQQEDEIKEFYTYQDWWEGRVFFGPWNQFCVDIYFDSNKRLLEDPNFDPSNDPPMKATFRTMLFRIPNDEYEKIKAKQEELFYADVEKTLDILKDNFLKRFRESENKPRLLQLEVETYEKLFYEEKFAIGSIRTNTISLNLGNRSWSMIEIGSIRDIYQERIVNGKKNFIATPSPNCHFGVGGGDHYWKQVEAYAKYFDWIKKFRSQMVFVPQENKYFSYSFSEAFTGIHLQSKHQLVFREFLNDPDKSLHYKHPEDDTLTIYFLNQIVQTDALEIEDFLNFHFDQFTGNKKTWLRFVESRWIDRMTDSDKNIFKMDPNNIYVKNWLAAKEKLLSEPFVLKVDDAPINEFEYLESIIVDIKIRTQLFKQFVQKNNIKNVYEERQKYADNNIPGEIEFIQEAFTAEMHRAKKEIHNHVLKLNDRESKSAYLNQVFQQILGLESKNEEQRKFYRELGDIMNDDLRIHSNYMIELFQLKRSVISDYKNYLDPDLIFNTDEKKFEHRILHNFHIQYEEILKHSIHDCQTRIHAEEIAEKLFSELKEDYIEQYDYIVQKWIRKNIEKGHNVNERDFINHQLNRVGVLFVYDKSSKTYSATDFQQRIFTFSEEYFDKYMIGIFQFFKKHWQMKLDEIDTFKFHVQSTNSGTTSQSFPENVLPKIDIPTLDDNKKIATDALLYLTGCNPHKEIIMSEANHKKLIEYVFHLIEFGTLPSKIKTIPKINISTETIRYTFYLIHKQLYGTNRIRQIWIDFLHAVFAQFKDQAPSTTKTKFSTKPALYDSDMRTMKK